MTQDNVEDFAHIVNPILSQALGQSVRLVGLRRLTGGASRDTRLLEVSLADGSTMQLLYRGDLGGEILEEALSRSQEFAILQLAHAAGVRVAEPIALSRQPPFFVTGWLRGESVGRRIVREPSLAAARKRLPGQLAQELAKIHHLDASGLTFLNRADKDSPCKMALERAAAQLHSLGEPHPVLEFALRKLGMQLPATKRVVLVQGDFRVGNWMIDAAGLVGVFDWEFAHLGDPHEDLAWPCVRSWRFGADTLRFGGVGSQEEFIAAYEQASGQSVNWDALRFWEMLGNLRWAIGCIAQAQRHLSGQCRSVELASLGRRTAEVEWELLNLLEGVNQ
jgi:aminoglycoside phosphotransferase (APT) family kinase protein